MSKTQNVRCPNHPKEDLYGFCHQCSLLMCQMCATKLHLMHSDKHLNFYLVRKKETKQIKTILKTEGAEYEEQLRILDEHDHFDIEYIANDLDRLFNRYSDNLKQSLDKLLEQQTKQIEQQIQSMVQELSSKLDEVGVVADLRGEFDKVFDVNNLIESYNLIVYADDFKEGQSEYDEQVKSFQNIDHVEMVGLHKKLDKVELISRFIQEFKKYFNKEFEKSRQMSQELSARYVEDIQRYVNDGMRQLTQSIKMVDG